VSIGLKNTGGLDEFLDDALIRPGRVDKKYLIDNATREQAKELFQRFYPETNGMAEKFVLDFPENKVSVATLQEHFLTYKNEPERTLERDWSE
tara:strand:+ start:8247 stop:8525 length:279 start_codon:yes stop_codon:yes gene_type:complete